MKDIYVLDTSVLLAFGPNVLHAYSGGEVVVPLVVISELDKKRHDPELGFIARRVMAKLDKCRSTGKPAGTIENNALVIDSKGTTFRVETNHVSTASLPSSLRNTDNDNRVLAVAKNLTVENASKPLDQRRYVHLITQDLGMRFKADIVGVRSEEFKSLVDEDDEYTGTSDVQIPDDVLSNVFLNGGKARIGGALSSVNTNTAVVVEAGDVKNTRTAFIIREDTGGKYIQESIRNIKCNAFQSADKRFSGRSVEQCVAIDHLMNDEIDIVSMAGPAGTGKTIAQIAAALAKVEDENSPIDRVIVFRNMHAVGGQELGFLPGTEAEKMDPWTEAVADALGQLVGKNSAKLMMKDKVEVKPLTHLRGRTLTNTYIIVDEAQNLDITTLLTVLSRMGEGSKTALSWDIDQRDNKYVGRTNGIIPVVDSMRGEKGFAHIQLINVERSRAAEMVARATRKINTALIR